MYKRQVQDVTREKELEANFKRFVSPEVLSILQRHGGTLPMATREHVTILFADLRGFRNKNSAGRYSTNRALSALLYSLYTR